MPSVNSIHKSKDEGWLGITEGPSETQWLGKDEQMHVC